MPLAEVDEDWEEWNPTKGKFTDHMIAGSIAGMVEHVSIFPFDTIKVRNRLKDSLGESFILF